MRLKTQRASLKKLLSGDAAFITLSEVFKRKDYNKLVAKLRSYQSLTLYLQAPPLSEIQELQNINSSLRDLTHTFNEIQLAIDQMVEDSQAIGFANYSDVIDNMGQVVKIMHDALAKSVRENLFVNRLDNLKHHKNVSNICEECRENHQATHLKKLRTEFGMLYPENGEGNAALGNFEKTKEKEDLALKEKEDFIDQINILLDKKDRMVNIPVNTRRYKDLVDCLTKMEELDLKLNDKDQLRKREVESQPQFGELDFADKVILETKYEKILEQVKQILNSKFREGYSNRIRSMLDKFQIVLKNDKTKKMEKKNFINLADKEIQTSIPVPEEVQIKILKEDLEKREIELAGIKEGRKKIEEKYIKLLESERKMSKDISGIILRNQKLQNEVEEKEKSIKYLRDEIIKYKSNGFDSARQGLQSQSSYTKIPNKNADRGKQNSNKSSSAIKTWKSINSTANQQTQTAADHAYSVEDEVQEAPREAKKKMMKMIRRMSHSSQNPMMKAMSELNDESLEKTRFQLLSKLLDIHILPTSSQKQEEPPKEDDDEKKKAAKAIKGKNLKKMSRSKKDQKRSEKILPNSLNQDEQIDEEASDLEQEPNYDQNERRRNSLKRSERDLSSRNNQKRSSRFAEQQIQNLIKKQESRASRQFKNMNFIRLTEIAGKNFRLNNIKTQMSKSKDDIPHHSITKDKDNIIRINKYEKKDSGSLDRQKVKEIVGLLKMQKDSISSKIRRSKGGESKNEQNQSKDRESMFSPESNDGDANQLKLSMDKQNEIQTKESVADTILQLKNLIESEYTYLKATGFIDFLLIMQKKPSQINRNLIKYKFEFSHISEGELSLFGGWQQMVRFSKGVGVWRRYIEDEKDLKLYFKHINFAHKISKYFILLKKMNAEFFDEYTSFIVDPLTFSQTHFSAPTVQSINHYIAEADFDRDSDYESMGCSQNNWKRIFMRLIRYHHEVHKNCQHIIEFLDKIGYYRYFI